MPWIRWLSSYYVLASANRRFIQIGKPDLPDLPRPDKEKWGGDGGHGVFVAGTMLHNCFLIYNADLLPL